MLNDGLKVVGDYAFYQCSSSKQIKINAKTLPKYLFHGCSKLAKAILGDKLEAIDTYAFFDCQSLHELHLPKSLKELKESAFAYLPLKKLYFEEHQFWDSEGEDGNTSFTPQDLYDPCEAARLFKKRDENRFRVNEKYLKQTSMSMEQAEEHGFVIEELEDGTMAIRDCEKEHVELIIPKSIDGKEVSELGGDDSSFILESLEKLVVLAEIKTINSSAFAYCGNLKSVLIPNTLERMGSSFEESELLQKEENGIRYLKFNNNPHYCALSFYGDDEVLSVHPDTKILTSWLFWECKAKQVILPDVEQLPCRLFYQAENLEEIDVPSNVTTIGPEAFSGCENLKRCDISSCRIAKISASTFEDCSSLEEVHLPDGTLVIGSNAFKNCSSLKVLSIPDSVHSIGKGAFEGCASLTAIGISDSKWEYTGPFGPIYFTGYYSTSPAQAAADLVSKYRGVCKKFNGTDEEFEALRNQDSAKNRMLLNIYYSSVKKE